LVDIHSHVLYGLDDGARTLEDSVAMIAMAAAAGTTDLVATPHASPRYKFEPERIRERLNEVEAATQGQVRLYTGCDFHLSYDNIEDALANPRKYTINQNRYLLVEFSDLMIFHNSGEIFQRLQDAGMTPVITHPERNPLLQFRMEQITQWVADGALVQVTGQSLLGHFGKKAAAFSHALLDRGLVHFFASDGHDLKHRPPTMDAARRWLARNYDDALAETLCVKNTKAALTGAPVEAPGTDRTKRRKWYQVWR
jgi:protein-tyrosine phosphatase